MEIRQHLFLVFFFFFFATGTRIIYERKFLLQLRNSPLSKTPPKNLPFIPGVTCDENAKPPPEGQEPGVTTSLGKTANTTDHGTLLTLLYNFESNLAD